MAGVIPRDRDLCSTTKLPFNPLQATRTFTYLPIKRAGCFGCSNAIINIFLSSQNDVTIDKQTASPRPPDSQMYLPARVFVNQIKSLDQCADHLPMLWLSTFWTPQSWHTDSKCLEPQPGASKDKNPTQLSMQSWNKCVYPSAKFSLLLFLEL